MYVTAYEDYVTPELLEKARIELKETPELVRQTLQKFRELLDEEPSLYPRNDDKFLIRYLRAKKYDVNKAFKTLRNYYSFQARYAGQVTNFLPSQLQHVLDMGCITVLPYREPGGSPVGLVRTGLYDEKNASAEEFIATTLLCSEVELEQEATLISGSVVIVDFKGFNMHKMMKFSSSTILSLLVSSYQDCVACRIKAIHVVNESHLFTVFFRLAKKFLSKKIKDRIFFHGNNRKSLQEHIPQEILPECLGGPVRINDEEFTKYMLSKDKYFEELNRYGYASNHRLQFKRLSFCL